MFYNTELYIFHKGKVLRPRKITYKDGYKWPNIGDFSRYEVESTLSILMGSVLRRGKRMFHTLAIILTPHRELLYHHTGEYHS